MRFPLSIGGEQLLELSEFLYQKVAALVPWQRVLKVLSIMVAYFKLMQLKSEEVHSPVLLLEKLLNLTENKNAYERPIF